MQHCRLPDAVRPVQRLDGRGSHHTAGRAPTGSRARMYRVTLRTLRIHFYHSTNVCGKGHALASRRVRNRMHVGEHSKNGPWPSPSGVRADNTPSSIKLKYAPMFLPLPIDPPFVHPLSPRPPFVTPLPAAEGLPQPHGRVARHREDVREGRGSEAVVQDSLI